MKNPHAINIFTDGSTLKNPGGKSGQGILVVYPDDEIAEYAPDGYKRSTNNRSELRAVIQALQYIQRQQKASGIDMVCIHSDSQYVVNGFPRAVGGFWQTVKWRTKDGNDIANQDLWKDLIREVKKTRKRIEVLKVKGHSGDQHNDKADALADSSRERAIKTDTEASRPVVRKWLSIPLNKREIEVDTNFIVFVQRTSPRQKKFNANVQVLRPKEYFGCRLVVVGVLASDHLRAGHIYEITLVKSGNTLLISKYSADKGNPTENSKLLVL